jgi:acetoin:2,6-dichlorophenolindophenol oxidoreductase subunit alpha
MDPAMTDTANDISDDQLLHFWVEMKRIRRFEEMALYQTTLNNVYGGVHAYIGQEAIAVGVCANLRKDDAIASTHRGHGHSIAKGARMDRMMAELFGREDGYCRGKGGSQHIADFEVGMLGANGIVGAGYGLAAGAALRAKRTGRDSVAACFFGDGAISRGTFHEVMNFAALQKLPLLFICEDNKWSQWIASKDNFAAPQVARLADAYGVPGVSVDGQDVRATYLASKSAVERARAGDGPTLLVFDTQRYYGHNSVDMQVYRTKADIAVLRETTDPIEKLERDLISADVASRERLDELLKTIDAEVEASVDFALKSALPSQDQLMEDVFAPVSSATH